MFAIGGVDLRASGQPTKVGRERRNVLQVALEPVREDVLVEAGRNGVLSSDGFDAFRANDLQ